MKFADSNAIGDFYTCASLLKEPARTKLQAVIRQYAQARLDLARDARRISDFESALATFGQLHTQMTEIVGHALIDGTPIAVSLTNTLNAVTSNQERLQPAVHHPQGTGLYVRCRWKRRLSPRSCIVRLSCAGSEKRARAVDCRAQAGRAAALVRGCPDLPRNSDRKEFDPARVKAPRHISTPPQPNDTPSA